MNLWRDCRWLGIVIGSLLAIGMAATQPPSGFALQVLQVLGQVEAKLPDGNQKRLQKGDIVPLGSIVRTQPKNVATLVWLPYKARVKLESDTQVQLTTNRTLVLQKGRIWLGTPPPPLGERRYPLPIQCRQVQAVGAPNAIFSIALQRDRTVLVSVDEGSVLVSAADSSVLVQRDLMVLISPFGNIVGPMLLTEQERLLWDMGGPQLTTAKSE